MENTVVLPPIKIGRKFVEELDEFVKAGYFRSRSEAVRDAIKFLVNEYRKRATIAESVKAVRETRNKMWNEILKEAGGDERKARDLFIMKFG